LKAHGWDNPSPRESSNKSKPPLHKSDVANLFNLAAGPVENTPEHKALEAEQGFGYRSVLGEILFAYVLCRPDVGYAVTTLAKFSTAPNALHYEGKGVLYFKGHLHKRSIRIDPQGPQIDMNRLWRRIQGPPSILEFGAPSSIDSSGK